MATALATKIDIAGCVLTPTGLRLSKGLPYDVWEQIGEKLANLEQSLQWWIGDWLEYGEHNYGEKYAAASSLTGYDPAYLRNLCYVARRIPETNRNPNLSFTHHRELAHLPLGKGRKWLQRAEKNRWTILRLRAELKLAHEINDTERAKPSHWWVYRVYSSRELLYVGFTNNLPSRLSQHGRKSWWADVERMETVRFGSRQNAMAEEHKLIKLIHPRHNRIHNLPEK